MPMKRKGVMIDKQQKKRNKIDDDDDSNSRSYIPKEVVIESVLTRLPAKSLARFACVSKLWHKSIFHDTRFAASHFSNNLNRRNLNFNLFNVPNGDAGRTTHYFFHLHKDDNDDRFYNFESLLTSLDIDSEVEPVGNCNGLTCVKPRLGSAGLEHIMVINPVWDEIIFLNYSTPKIGGGSLKYLCHGFGFDSLSQEYKVVLIYRTKTAAGDPGLICMVATLGDPVWRKIVCCTSEISPPPGSYPLYTSRPVTRIREDINKSATICGGDLFWRITNSRYDGEEIEMLLSFDIHNEKIQFIELPRKRATMMPERIEDGLQEIRHHLLEYKGYPCVARSKKILIDEGLHPGSSKFRFCYYRFKVQMHVLKDKVEQKWTEVENFDVRFMKDCKRSITALRNPFYQYFNRTEDLNNHRLHPTRMLSFSDQVMLYWFDGECLIFYNLQTEHHCVVKGARSSNKGIPQIFNAKISGLPVSDVPECPCSDYQLHAQVENIVSLETYIPKGREVREFDSYEKLLESTTDKEPVGWVAMGRTSKWYAFF